MKTVVVLGLFTTLVGCAFQEPRQIDDARIRLTADWVSLAGALPRDQVKASRDLIQKSEAFESVGSITVPVLAPEWVVLGATIPESALLAGAPRFARAFLEIESKTFELPVRLTHAQSTSGLSTLGFQLGGLRALIPDYYSARTLVRLDVFSETQRLTTLTFKVRTPPSQVDKVAGGVKDAQAKTKPGESGLISSRVSGTQFNLIREFTFQNQEDAPIEIQIPRKISGLVRQWVNPITYRDLGCNGQGYAIDENPHLEVLAEKLYLLPMDQTWVVEAERDLRRPDDMEPIMRPLKPADVIRIGLYAVGEKVNNWAEVGPLPRDLRSVTVPGQCYRECDDLLLLDREWPDRPDRCLRWVHKRRNAQITVGIDRGAVELQFPTGAPRLRYRFADFETNQDSEIREHLLTEDLSVVPWSEQGRR